MLRKQIAQLKQDAGLNKISKDETRWLETFKEMCIVLSHQGNAN